MPRYEVVLTRTVTQRYRLEVEAADAPQAIQKAQARQGDLDFSEGATSDAEYGVGEVIELEDDHE
jgi:hypothetical protein